MKKCNCNHNNQLLKVLTVIAVGCIMILAKAGESAPLSKQADSPIVAKCTADLAKRLKLNVQNINVIDVQATTWADASLGMPEMGKLYAQVITPGFRIILERQGSQYLYTASAKAFKYGGPTAIWSYSMLYTKPIQDEPNFNADLYQCSLLGTNSVRIVSGVTDYYPQSNSVVIVKRRTSRSSHELLYVKADGSEKANLMYSAFDLGEAAFNDGQKEWAGFVRPTVGAEWTIVVSNIGQDNAKVQTLSLPEGTRPGRIAWSGEKLMILVPKGDKTICFETSPKVETKQWNAVGTHLFPGLPEYMLNKSESLEINQIKENDKSSVEVARVWFTGDRNVITRINDFTLRGYDLLTPFAIVWGEKDLKSAVSVVDIGTGEVISSFGGVSQDIKPFSFPLRRNPIVSGKSD